MLARSMSVFFVAMLLLSLPVIADTTYVPGGDLVGDYEWTASGSPYVLQGNVTIPHHEPFTDWSGNGEWDELIPEYLEDLNGNGVWDDSLCESYADTNGNGQWDPNEPHWDDYNENGSYDCGYEEPYEDWNGNGQWDQLVTEPWQDLNDNSTYDTLLVLSITTGCEVLLDYGAGIAIYGSLEADGTVFDKSYPGEGRGGPGLLDSLAA